MTNPHNDEYYIKESFKETYPVLSIFVGFSFLLALVGGLFSGIMAFQQKSFLWAGITLTVIVVHLIMRFVYSRMYEKFYDDWHQDTEE